MERRSILLLIVLTSGHNHIDPQTRKKPPEPIIPVVSPVLNVVSMTTVVFLRRRFGYSYLQPASSFIIIAFALTLFSAVAILSQNENTLWYHTRTLSIFILLSIVLFFCHWLVAYFSIYLRKSEHEQSSGKSWLGGKTDVTRILIEPVLIFIIGAALYFYTPETLLLGMWLFIAAIAMSIKEALGCFHSERKYQQLTDSDREMGDLLEKNEQPSKAPIRKTKSSAMRKSRKKSTESNEKVFKLKRRYARILGMEPPYTFAQARAAYRRKIKATHSETNLPDDTQLSEEPPDVRELRKARDFFKIHGS